MLWPLPLCLSSQTIKDDEQKEKKCKPLEANARKSIFIPSCSHSETSTPLCAVLFFMFSSWSPFILSIILSKNSFLFNLLPTLQCPE